MWSFFDLKPNEMLRNDGRDASHNLLTFLRKNEKKEPQKGHTNSRARPFFWGASTASYMAFTDRC
jgi:hypothetical protein